MKDRSEHLARMEARRAYCRKFVTPAILEVAKVYVPLNEDPRPKMMGTLEHEAYWDAHERLSRVVHNEARYPSEDELWVAAQEVARTELEAEGYKRPEYEYPVTANA